MNLMEDGSIYASGIEARRLSEDLKRIKNYLDKAIDALWDYPELSHLWDELNTTLHKIEDLKIMESE